VGLLRQQAKPQTVFTLLAWVIFMLVALLVTVMFVLSLKPQGAVAVGLLAPEEMAVIILLIGAAVAAHQAVT
jgi:hypothetical protein